MLFLKKNAAISPKIGKTENMVKRCWYSSTPGSFPNTYPVNKDINISGVNPIIEIIPTNVPVILIGAFNSSISAKYNPLKE